MAAATTHELVAASLPEPTTCFGDEACQGSPGDPVLRRAFPSTSSERSTGNWSNSRSRRNVYSLTRDDPIRRRYPAHLGPVRAVAPTLTIGVSRELRGTPAAHTRLALDLANDPDPRHQRRICVHPRDRRRTRRARSATTPGQAKILAALDLTEPGRYLDFQLPTPPA